MSSGSQLPAGSSSSDDDDRAIAVSSVPTGPALPVEQHQLMTGRDQKNEREDDREEEAVLVWQEQEWELTWPIWHMLPRHERRTQAQRHGYKTIGEFEEYMSLQRAVDETTTRQDSWSLSSWSKPYENQQIYNHSSPVVVTEDASDRKLRAVEDDDDDEEEEHELIESESSSSLMLMSQGELMKLGGQLLLLPEEMLHRIFDWLPVDAYATLALVSPHWKSFTRTEAVYKRLCERLYLYQSKRKALHVSSFGNSYRTMLEKRPRVRAGGGVYVLKYSRVQSIQRDMWTEIPLGAVLEHVYYRYLYFQENGRVLYALTTSPPHEMFPRFLKVCLSSSHDDAAVWGTYQVHKRHVTVIAKQPWQYVKLDLNIEPNNLHGRYGILSFEAHVTNSSGNFNMWSSDRVVYEVPEEPFRFVPDKRL